MCTISPKGGGSFAGANAGRKNMGLGEFMFTLIKAKRARAGGGGGMAGSTRQGMLGPSPSYSGSVAPPTGGM